jgi:hypothetical protein
MAHNEIVEIILYIIGLVLLVMIIVDYIDKQFVPLERLVEKVDKETIQKFSQYNRHKHTYYANIRFFDNTAMCVMPLPSGIKSCVLRRRLSDFINSLEKAIHDYIVTEEIDFEKIKKEIVMKIRLKESFFIEVGKGKRFTIGLIISIF